MFVGIGHMYFYHVATREGFEDNLDPLREVHDSITRIVSDIPCAIYLYIVVLALFIPGNGNLFI
jgi:hypothetical protein